MLEDPQYKFRWAIIGLTVNPYNLSPGLAKVLDRQIDLLIKNPNEDIGVHLVNNLRNSTSLRFLDVKVNPSNWPKYLKASVRKRATLCFFSKYFNWRCSSRLMSASGSDSLRINTCQPLGMSASGHHYCKCLFCPNCYMRKAAKTRKYIKEKIDELNLTSTRAIVVSWNCRAQETKYGFNFKDDPVNITRRIINKLKGINYIAIRTLGADINDRRPMSATRAALFLSDPSKETEALSRLVAIKSSMFKKYVDIDMSISVEEGVDNTAYRLYDCPPICLAGVSEDSLDSSMLHHTVESFKHFIAGKKTICVFGPGVEIEQ